MHFVCFASFSSLWPVYYGDGPGAESTVGGSGRGQSPPEAECLFVFACAKENANLPHY